MKGIQDGAAGISNNPNLKIRTIARAIIEAGSSGELGGLTAVAHDESLEGTGTTAEPLGVAQAVLASIETLETDLGDLADQVVDLQNKVRVYGLKISDTFTQAVANTQTYNLLTTVDLATDVPFEANLAKSNYSIADGALKLPTSNGYVDYSIEVRLSGTFGGGENTSREFGVQLQRSDGTIITEKSAVKVAGNDLSKRAIVFETYTNTETDPFIAGGLKLVINNTSGQTLNITGCDILIKGRL